MKAVNAPAVSSMTGILTLLTKTEVKYNMQSLYILIPLAIFLVFLAVCIFIWAVNANQFEDLEKQGMSVLFDDDKNQHLPTKRNDPSL